MRWVIRRVVFTVDSFDEKLFRIRIAAKALDTSCSEESNCKESLLSRQAGATIFFPAPCLRRDILIFSLHVSDNISIHRRQNVLHLFQLHAEAQMQAGAPPKGMEQSFAQKLQISPSMWSQIKRSRPIGDKLARQIEAACDQSTGWLDQAQADRPQGLSASEQQFLSMALKAWRATNAEGRKRLKMMIKEMTQA